QTNIYLQAWHRPRTLIPSPLPTHYHSALAPRWHFQLRWPAWPPCLSTPTATLLAQCFYFSLVLLVITSPAIGSSVALVAESGYITAALPVGVFVLMFCWWWTNGRDLER